LFPWAASSPDLASTATTRMQDLQKRRGYLDATHLPGRSALEPCWIASRLAPGNVRHLALSHGTEPEEAEEVFAIAPLVRRTRRGHYAAFSRTQPGRLLVIIFEMKVKGVVRVIAGWDMDSAERRYYQRHRRG